MTDISIRGFDGDGGGPIGGGMDRVAVQPDFANMTLEQIQAWETAHNTNPLTGAVPASAVVEPHLTDVPAVPLRFDEDGQRVVDEPEPPTLSLIPGGGEDVQTAEQQGNDEHDQAQELIRAEFSLGEPFIHVVAYLTQGPVEIVATPFEALALYQKLAEALGEAQRAGVIQ